MPRKKAAAPKNPPPPIEGEEGRFPGRERKGSTPGTDGEQPSSTTHGDAPTEHQASSTADSLKAAVAARLRAAQFLTGDLAKIVTDELKKLQVPWGSLPEKNQAEVIARVVDAVKPAARKAVALIAAVNRPSAEAEIESVLFKDGIKVQLTMSKRMADRHAIADAQGLSVLLVLPMYEAVEGGDPPKAQKDQADLLEST